MKASIEQAKKLFNDYIGSLKKFKMDSYEMFDDDATITSSRGGIAMITWQGKKFKKTIGPSIVSARESNRQIDINKIHYEELGDNILLTGSFVPTTPGQSGDFSAVIGYNKNKVLMILEYHDGKIIKDTVRATNISVEEENV